MPDLKNILKERDEKKFSKKSYRPWDLSGEKNDQIEYESNEKKITQNSTQEISTDIINQSDINQISNGYQSDIHLGNKQTSNRYQSDIDLDSNKTSNWYQSDTNLDNNKISNRYQLDIKQPQNKSIFTSDNKDISKPLNSNLSVLSDELNLNYEIQKEMATLSGKQKIIFDVIVDICSAKNSFETGPIQTVSLSKVAQTTVGTIKVIIDRLVKKQLILRHKGKNAKGGFINLGVTKDVLELVKNNKYPNFSSIDFLISNRYQKDINLEYNSSSNLNKTTTIKNDPDFFEFEKIDFENLSNIGFSKNQLKQLIGKNTPDVIQESINHFSWGLDNNPKFKKYEDPLNVLMGVLRKGQAWVEKDYRSPQEIAQEKLLEIKKAEIDRKRKLIDDAYKLALTEWENSLNNEKREEITQKTSGDLTPSSAKLSIYFKNNIWPLIQADYVVVE